MRNFNKFGTAVAVAALFAATGTAARADDAAIQSLQQQINALQQQLKDVQAKQATVPAAGPLAGAATVPTEPSAIGPFVPASTQTGGFLQTGSDIGSFQVPGTKTAVKVGGFMKLDLAWDADAGMGIAGMDQYGIRQAADNTGNQGFALPGTPGARQQGRFSSTAAYSRLYIDSRTPTEWGDVKMYLEGDFSGPASGGNSNNSNSHDFRIRHAYGTLGNWTFGQTWTNFTDPASWAVSLDNNGPIGRESGVRQALVQYRWDIDPEQKNQLAVSIENPDSDFLGSDDKGENFIAGAGNYAYTNFNSKLPDFVAKYTHNETWGHMYEATLVRNLEANTVGVNLGSATTGYTGAVHDNTWAWGEQVGAKIFTGLGHPKNAIGFHGVIGQGISRYMQVQQNSAEVDSQGHLKTLLNGAYHVYYQHFWDPKGQFQSNVIWGDNKIWYKNSLLVATAPQGLETDVQEVELNFLWTPNQFVQMGPAYIRANVRAEQGYNLSGVAGATRSWSGSTAVDNRFQYSVIIGF